VLVEEPPSESTGAQTTAVMTRSAADRTGVAPELASPPPSNGSAREEVPDVAALPETQPIASGWWSRRRNAMAGASLAVLLAAGGVALIVLPTPDSSPSQARVQLRAGVVTGQPSLTSALGATRLRDLQTTGSLARDTQQPMATIIGAASTIQGSRFRVVTEAALRAERAYLADLARLSALSSSDLAAWAAGKPALQRDALALTTAQPGVTALHLQRQAPLLLAPIAAKPGDRNDRPGRPKR
jgi:hypothetical protein